MSPGKTMEEQRNYYRDLYQKSLKQIELLTNRLQVIESVVRAPL